MSNATGNQAKALELHLAGATYDTIAEQVGYASRSGAFAAVQAALDAGVPVGDDLVQTELARLDAMLSSVWAKARRGDLAAVDRVLKISERRTALGVLRPSVPVVSDAIVGTGLSDFEQRLAEREAKNPRRTAG